MEPRPGLPSFWTSHLARVMVGDQACLLAPWLQGRFTMPQRDSADFANWKADHTALLQQTVRSFQGAGWKCDVERFFRVTGQHAIVSGKTDLIAQKTFERPTIVDAKSGFPKDADVAQVLIEMVLIPLAWKTDMTFQGQVVYQAPPPIVVSSSAASAFRPKLFAMVKQLATMPRPEPTPSRDACRFCPVPDANCGVRWKEEHDAQAITAEF